MTSSVAASYAAEAAREAADARNGIDALSEKLTKQHAELLERMNRLEQSMQKLLELMSSK